QRKGIVEWSAYDDFTVWSAAIASDSVFSIGYSVEGYSNLDQNIHLIDVENADWKAVKEALISYVVDETKRKYPEMISGGEDLLVFGEKSLPYFNIRIWDYEILANIRNFSVVRYAEPMGFGFETQGPLRSSSGCGGNTGISNPNPSDYFTAPQGPRISWNFIDMQIHRAWKASNRGDGVTIGVIDTGISSDQAKLNGEFSGGLSGDRYVERYGFHEPCFLFLFCENDGIDDLCGHGTNMAGTAAAPASADGSFAGVAFKSNLIGVRAAEDVIHNSSAEKDGVSDAYTFLGNRADVNIISMSMGDLFSSGQITDAINFAHNQGKMIFTAAGTSLEFTTFVGVIFPATLSNTIAVTGTKTGFPIEKCSTCHSGSQVDFVVTMEDRNNSNRTPLTLADSGNDPNYTGGSSVATATAAGIAALVWSNDLSQSREDVLEAMKNASNFYPNRDGNFGWGKINARSAVLF
ncbi:MAG: S8 family serine peptidase, partial [Flavobacteriales bacterium]|nr:S8 family serine peptidase [Flavobacteriales bacterium]